jgi:flagellin-like hook-associated protein FlgL
MASPAVPRSAESHEQFYEQPRKRFINDCHGKLGVRPLEVSTAINVLHQPQEREHAMTTTVNLTAAINANLLSLQNTQTLLNQTQLALSTGKKVNSALDNPSAFFAAQSLSNRSSDLGNVLNNISQGVQTIQTANDGITAITSLLQQAQSVAQQALSESNANAGGAPTDAASLSASFNQILQQITNLANDASYQGTNLLNSSTNKLTVTYDETGKSTQTIQGTNFTAGSNGTQGTGYAGPVVGTVTLPASGNVSAVVGDTLTINGGTAISLNQSTSAVISAINAQSATTGATASLNSTGKLVISSTVIGQTVTIGGTNGATDTGLAASTAAVATGGGLGITNAGNGSGLDWNSVSASANIGASLTAISTALTTVRAQASTLGQSLGTVQTYQSFNTNLINDLTTGSSDLTAADTNQESAALLTLQTQQQLGISALSLASQAQQAVLKLFP